MPYYKFNEDDVFFNRIKAHPSCHFFSWKGCTYYNNQYAISGAFNIPIGHAGYTISGYWGENALGYGSYTSSCNSGYINLYEWRLFGHNSSRILHPTEDGSSGMSWFYVGLPPYNLHPTNNGAMEKPWPTVKNPQG